MSTSGLLEPGMLVGPREGEREHRVLRLTGVSKRFGSQVVLDGVNLDIEEGKTTVVMGPSGCGKSVTLKHFVGLLRPDEGEVWFEGRAIARLSERELGEIRLRVGMVFQMGALFDSMSVIENIEFPLREHTSLSRNERAERVLEALETVDLAGLGSKLPSQVSGGQRKRVAIARAMVLRPRVMLFDEPTTGLDPVRSDGINRLIRKLQETFGVTNVVVTHDLTSAQRVADRVVMLMGGKVIADGTYDALTRSTDARVQHFLTGTYEAAEDDESTHTDATRTTQA